MRVENPGRRTGGAAQLVFLNRLDPFAHESVAGRLVARLLGDGE